MKVPVCVLLLSCLALAQKGPPRRPPPGPPPAGGGGPKRPPPGPQGGPERLEGLKTGPAGGPAGGQPRAAGPGPMGPGGPGPMGPGGPGPKAGPGGPAAPGGAPAAPGDVPNNNPWHELLHRMMELMHTAASLDGTPGGAPADPNAPVAQPQVGGPGPGNPMVGGGQGPRQPGPQGQAGPGKQSGPGPKQGPGGPMGGGPMGGGPMGGGPMGGGPMGGGPMGPGGPMVGGPMGPGGPMVPGGPGPKKGGPSRPPVAMPTPGTPAVKDCFWKDKFYRPGSDIVRGQHDRWCYVTYCDSKGDIQFWDDYNCPPNSMKPTSGHNTGRPEAPQQGCNYGGVFYEAGQEISSHQVGEKCYGTYCSKSSQVTQWEDWCTTQAPAAAPTQPPPPRQAGPGPAAPAPRPGPGPAQPQMPPMAPRAPVQPKPQPPQQPQQPAAPRVINGPANPQQGRGGPARGGAPKQGCYHNKLYYQPNEDVIVGNIGDMCYGYYCEGDNVFVHWEDRCANANVGAAVPTAAPATQPPAAGGMGGFWI